MKSTQGLLNIKTEGVLSGKHWSTWENNITKWVCQTSHTSSTGKQLPVHFLRARWEGRFFHWHVKMHTFKSDIKCGAHWKFSFTWYLPPAKKYKNNSLLVYLCRMMKQFSLFPSLLSEVYRKREKNLVKWIICNFLSSLGEISSNLRQAELIPVAPIYYSRTANILNQLINY